MGNYINYIMKNCKRKNKNVNEKANNLDQERKNENKFFEELKNKNY